MSPGLRLLFIVLAVVTLGAAAPGPEVPKPEITDLGQGRYRVGPVEIDKTQNRFTVPGHVLRDEPPRSPALPATSLPRYPNMLGFQRRGASTMLLA